MRRFLTNKILLGVLCIAIGMIPLLTLVNTAGSGKAMVSREFNYGRNKLISVKFNGAAVNYTNLKELQQEMPEIKTMIPVSKSQTQLSSYKASSMVELKAVGEDYWRIAGLKIIKGSFMSKEHVKTAQNVIVLDELTADKLFGTREVLGRNIELSLDGAEIEASIIGVCKRNDISDGNSDTDKGIAFIPISLLDYNSNAYGIDETMFLSDLHVEETKARLLHYFAGIGIDQTQLDITYITQLSIINSFIDEYMKAFLAAGLLWFFAAIIALINILLVDIEKHRKYYGLLKFYGNTEKQIRRIVFSNALIVGMASSVFSIIIGLISSFAVCNVLNIPIFVSVHTLTLSILLPGVICLAAAVYPAIKAAETDMNKVVWQ